MTFLPPSSSFFLLLSLLLPQVLSVVSGFGGASAAIKRAKKAGFKGNLKGEGFILGAVIISGEEGQVR